MKTSKSLDSLPPIKRACVCNGTLTLRYPNHGFLTVQQGITLALSNSTCVPFLNDEAQGKAYSRLGSIQLQRLAFPE